ncbi:hypothetical protein SAMN05216207_10528 [Pseudonocardia ammonioxydans]|uniref:Uncharacterized protein n=1 Tax=Pseudonocardia ammonioxydans TaxID=260086 RepID=A0A1I5GWJ8_PSUAM|nr:hypothetical protein [Pseudonocardia ammonioxydans]SFO40382.1 hypothetical protein SAMN05216207_10528 [Pseudonocardia ammonioxydans]
MSLDSPAAEAESQVEVLPPDRGLDALLADRRQTRTRGDSTAIRQLTERLQAQPSMQDFRNDLEDALVGIAAQVVQAMIRLREQRQENVVDPDAVADNVTTAAEALCAAELTLTVMRSVVPVPRS